jgi:hypothetical protein
MVKYIRYLLTPLFSIFIVAAHAQDHSQLQEKSLSPQATVEGKVGGAKTTIVYCRPSARGRKMVGVKDPYGQVWRTGANAATTIEFDRDVLIEGKRLPEGKYGLFTIPNEKEWVIIFNKVYDQWGAYDYQESQDVLRVTVKASHVQKFVETFTIKTDRDKIGLTWENFYVAFRVKAQ